MTSPTVTLNDTTTIPQIGYGVFLVPPADTQRHVETALELGYRHIDTAAIYGNEEGVGRALAASGLPREELYITTKLWNSNQGRNNVTPAFTKSLDLLGLDYVDLYLIHWPTPARNLYLETWEALETLADEGLTRSIGVSNFLPEHLHNIINLGGRTPVLNQIEVHPTLTQRSITETNAALNIATEAWSPLGRGVDLALPQVTSIAERLNATPAQIILAWHLAQGTIVLPKSVTPSRMAENLTATTITLTDEDIHTLSSLNTGERVGPDPATFNEH